MIAIVDYGVGNLFSLQCSLTYLGIEAEVTGNAQKLAEAERVILPGVGAFGDAARKLRQSGLEEPVKEYALSGRPLLGICLGMQLLFESGDEFGLHEGLGLLQGRVVPLQKALGAVGFAHKVPHMGWNRLEFVRPASPILKYSKEDEFVYYVHSNYAVECDNSICAQSEYGVMVPGLVQSGNVFGTQFHPEKSGKVGLAMLQAFAEV